MPPTVVAVVAAALWLQVTTPLKKSDVIRLLSTSLAPEEIADLVQRRCVSFTPSARDKADLRALGAGDQLLLRLDECARRIATPAPARTGFVSGTGQRGRVGTRLPLPVVFEARDTANRPVPAQTLTLVGHNAHVEPTKAVTDSNGRVVAFVTLGVRAGPASVVAALDGMERQAPLVALPGPPANLVLRCGTTTVSDHLVLGIGVDHVVTVRVEDASGNHVPFSDLHVTAADPRTVRVAVATDAITFRALRAGSTSVVVGAAGMRRTIATVVGAADVTAGCRREVPGG